MCAAGPVVNFSVRLRKSGTERLFQIATSSSMNSGDLPDGSELGRRESILSEPASQNRHDGVRVFSTLRRGAREPSRCADSSRAVSGGDRGACRSRGHGRNALLVLARLLRRSATSIDSAEGRFRGHQAAFILGGRFLPELNPIVAGMAGATHMRPTRYTLIAMTSALAWAFAWTGAGYA